MKTPDQSQISPDKDLFDWAKDKKDPASPEVVVSDEVLEPKIETIAEEKPVDEEPYCPMCQNGGFCIKHQTARTEKNKRNFFPNETDTKMDDVNKELSLAAQHREPEKPMTKAEMDEMFDQMQEELRKLG